MTYQSWLTSLSCAALALMIAGNPAAATQYSDAVQADNPLAYYQFSETSGSTVADTMGLQNGTVTGAPALGAAGLTSGGMGASNTAINFGGNGSGDSIDLDQAVSAAMIGASAITTELWIKGIPTNSTAQNVTTLFANTSAGANIAVLNGQIRGGGRSTSSDGYKSYSFVNIPTDGPDGWTHVVAINDYANAKAILYLNGSPAVNVDITGWAFTTFQVGVASTRSDRIAATDTSADEPSLEAGGLMDEVAFYNYALSPAQVLAHYQAAAIATLHPGDANGDGMVNLADLQILGDNWQSTTASWSQADFTGDGNVNLADLQILGDNWGFGVSADVSFDEALSGVVIPEPAGLSLIALGCLSLLMRR